VAAPLHSWEPPAAASRQSLVCYSGEWDRLRVNSAGCGSPIDDGTGRMTGLSAYKVACLPAGIRIQAVAQPLGHFLQGYGPSPIEPASAPAFNDELLQVLRCYVWCNPDRWSGHARYHTVKPEACHWNGATGDEVWEFGHLHFGGEGDGGCGEGGGFSVNPPSATRTRGAVSCR
jgi:hypothetical protein